jgi:protein TonB
MALAIVISAGLHGSLLLAVRRHAPVVAHDDKDQLAVIRIVMPDLKDLEEPDPAPRDDAEKPDLADYAPTLTDAPQIALPTDFVQEINYASLLPPPDLSQAKVFVIPQNIIRSGKVGGGLGNIFNLADLDKVPEPVIQPSPVFPPALKREVDWAKVTVEFIVDKEGRVRDPVVVETSDAHQQFSDAATLGISRWRFRPGMRGGVKVNTRMSVPIIFRVSEKDL